MAGEELFYSFSEAGYNQLPAGHQQTSPWVCMQSSGIVSLPAGYRALSGEPASAGIGSNQLSAVWAAKRAGAELSFQHGRYSSSGWGGHMLLLVLLLPTRACGQQHPQSCSLCCNGLRYFLKAASYVCYPCSYTRVNMYVYSKSTLCMCLYVHADGKPGKCRYQDLSSEHVGELGAAVAVPHTSSSQSEAQQQTQLPFVTLPAFQLQLL